MLSLLAAAASLSALDVPPDCRLIHYKADGSVVERPAARAASAAASSARSSASASASSSSGGRSVSMTRDDRGCIVTIVEPRQGDQ